MRAYAEEVRMRINVASLVEKHCFAGIASVLLAPVSRVGREDSKKI